MKVGHEIVRMIAAALRGVRKAAPLLGALLVFAALGPVLPAAAEETMSFELITIAGKGGCPRDCAEVIAAEGEIDNDTADRFVTFLSDHLQDRDLRPVILIQSPGGTVIGAMQLGTVFRHIGAAVIVGSARPMGNGEEARVVPGACLSACVYAFAGGVRRVVPPVSRLGIHRMVINERVFGPDGAETRKIFGSKDIVASLAAYTRAMGVDPRMIDYAETISPDQLHIVTPREIARWRLGRPRL